MKTLHNTLEDLYKYMVDSPDRDRAIHIFNQHMEANERFHTDLDALQVALRRVSNLIRITCDQVMLANKPGSEGNWHPQNLKRTGEEILEAKTAVLVIRELVHKLAHDERLME